MPESVRGWSRRAALGGLAGGALALGFLAGGCARARPLRVATCPWAGYELEWLAQDRSLVDTSRYHMDRQTEHAAVLDLLRRGTVAAATLGLEQVLHARAGGMDLEVVLIIAESRGADGLIVREPVASAAELAGKTVALDGTAGASLLLERSLEGSGVSVSALRTVPLPADLDAAWDAGELAGVVTREPILSRLERRGARRLADTSRMSPFMLDVFAIRRDLGPDAYPGVREVVRAYLLGRQVLRSNPVDSGFRLAGRLGMEHEEVLGIFRRLLLPDLDYNRRLLAQAREPELSCQPLAERLMRGGAGRGAMSCSGLFTDRFLPETLA
jgi:NitT/TauT family transport system substrate-binding protein